MDILVIDLKKKLDKNLDESSPSKKRSLSFERYLVQIITKNNCLYCSASHVKNKNINLSRILSPETFVGKSKQYVWVRELL